jgi:hypothetical protein
MRASAIVVLVCLAVSLSGCRVAGWVVSALLGQPITLTGDSKDNSLPGQSREDNPSIHPKMLMEPTSASVDD